MAPAIRGRKGEYAKLFEQINRDGYVRVMVDSEVYDIEEVPQLDKNKKHNIDVVIDRIVIKDNIRTRLNDSLEAAFTYGAGLAKVVVIKDEGNEEMLFSQNYACPDCNISIEELSPRMFSFNNPFGACPECMGLGMILRVDPNTVIADPKLSLRQGAISTAGWQSNAEGSIASMYFKALSEHYGFSLDTPWEELSQKAKDVILYGTKGEKIRVSYTKEYGNGTFISQFEGIIPNIERRYRETSSEEAKKQLESYMSTIWCNACKGKRLKPESLAVTIQDKSIAELSDMTVVQAREFLASIELTPSQKIIAERILKELNSRLTFLINVGLDYLTLSRFASTLSGGEAQRIRLATQIGSGLVGVLYILDEPSIGLHQRDNQKLIDSLKGMRDLGNTLIVVEHDEDTIRSADYVVDIGPGAGEHGGNVVCSGTLDEIMKCEHSITAQFLTGEREIKIPERRRQPNGKWLCVKGAAANNLKSIDVNFPIGLFTCVTGVSGSGKSSLVNEIVRKKLLADLNRARTRPGKFESITGVEYLDKVIDIDQSPIGRTPRSNPATYTGVFDLIRKLFALTPSARARGYTSGRFSFNVRGGRCENCAGDGIIKIEMHFLPDVYVPCEVCQGKRYNRETLEVKYKGKSIADVLDMTVENALNFFDAHPSIQAKLKALYDVGLGYIRLGQPSTTLSGGEAQRVKLATELARRDTGKTLYILDEPTTGLHIADVERLLDILQRLCNNGSTIIVIEHNLDVIKTADYIIDLGPEGGDRGGEVVVCGTPEEVAECEHSYTGQFLRKTLAKHE